MDGEIYKVENVDYASEITPVNEPTKEGYTFSGWSEIPETMPAQDITITGSFTAEATTGVDKVKRGNGNAKVIYDLHGSKVKPPVNGVYIIDGKKVII